MSDNAPIKVEGGPLEPAAIQTIVLMQLSNRTRRVAEAIEKQGTQNRSTSGELQVTDQECVYDPAFPLFGISIRNDGPANIYISVNTPLMRGSLQAPIFPDETFAQNGTQATITRVYLTCLAGQTAKVRIWGYA
jgi:hypothetical protein